MYTYGKKTQFNSVARFLVFTSGRDVVSYESMRFSFFFSFFLFPSLFSPDPEESAIIEIWFVGKIEISPLATMIHSNPRIVPAFLLNISIGGLRCGEGKDAGDEDSSAQEIILWNGRG